MSQSSVMTQTHLGFWNHPLDDEDWSTEQAPMLTRAKIFELLRENYPYLANQFGVKRIGLFGSYVRDDASPNSDVDLVVEFQRPIGLQFIDLVEYLEQLLGKKVDVLTPAGIQNIRVDSVAQRITKSIVYV